MRNRIIVTLLLLVPCLGFAAAIPILTVNNATINYGVNQVTFSGSGFEPAKKAPTVLFNGAPLTVNSYTNTQIVATLPAHTTAGTYAIIIANSGGQFSSFDLTYGAAGPQGPQGTRRGHGAPRRNRCAGSGWARWKAGSAGAARHTRANRAGWLNSSEGPLALQGRQGRREERCRTCSGRSTKYSFPMRSELSAGSF